MGIIYNTLNLIHSMGKSQICTINEMKKVLKTRQGMFVYCQPSESHEGGLFVNFSLCKYEEVPNWTSNMNPDESFKEYEAKLFHYDSFEELHKDYPKIKFDNMENYDISQQYFIK